MNDQKQEQLAGLLELLLDGSADDFSKQKIVELLRDDPDAQQWYVEYCQMHAMLAWEHGALPAFVFDVAPQNQSFDSERLSLKRLSRRWQWLAICASILFAFSVGMLVYGPLENHPVASVRSGDQSLQATRQKTPAGVVLYADQAVWEDSTVNVATGDLVFDEPLRLNSGTVQIALFGGATITLDGPCQLDLYSSTRGYLQHGSIFVSVKKDNVKLEIDTPAGQMVHLGTEFGVSVAETGETDMFVFDGAVELKQLDQGMPAGSARVVYEGQAMRLQTSGRANTIRNDTFEARRAKYEGFTRSTDFQPRPLIVSTDGYELRYVKARSNAITSLFEADRLLSDNIPSDEDWTVRGLEYINFQDRGILPE